MNRRCVLVLGGLLCLMTALVLWPMWDETATVDETTFMGGGYAYLRVGTCKMAEENPLLVQVLMALPMLAFDVHLSDEARAIMEQRAFSPVGWPWSGPPRPLHELFTSLPNFYHYGLAEAQHFGRIVVYDPHNEAEAMLFGARMVMWLFTLGTTLLVGWWTRERTRDNWAGVAAAALWGLNPVALAYGHLAITEPGIALMYPLAIWWYGKVLEQPSTTRVLLLGVLCALAMQMKFLALILGPTFLVMLVWTWWTNRPTVPWGRLSRWGLVFIGAAWGATLLIYFPNIAPPPPIDAAQAEALRVPAWFQSFRPLLMPGEFFKAVTLKLLHSRAGQDAFLCGEWRKMGWWYYYPLAMWFKTPLPLLIATGIAAGLLVRDGRRAMRDGSRLLPWIGAAMFVLLSLNSTINIGVRHMLPVYPLLAVGTAVELWRAGRWGQRLAVVVLAWIGLVAFWVWPHFIPYTNELGGGTAHGYRVLIDSNYDWGQDGKRLKRWMAANGIRHIYLDFFGTQTAIEWHRIPNTRVDAHSARQIRHGWLVVSVSQLMRPEWSWLRQARPLPDARIAYSLFAYRFD